MDQLTTNVRYQQWFQLIQEQKSSGLSIRKWCQDNSLNEKTFHYYQSKLRVLAAKAACPQLVEIKQPVSTSQAAPYLDNLTNSAATILSGGVAVAINNNASEELITRIVRALNAE